MLLRQSSNQVEQKGQTPQAAGVSNQMLALIAAILGSQTLTGGWTTPDYSVLPPRAATVIYGVQAVLFISACASKVFTQNGFSPLGQATNFFALVVGIPPTTYFACGHYHCVFCQTPATPYLPCAVRGTIWHTSTPIVRGHAQLAVAQP